MRAVIQRTKRAAVNIDRSEKTAIGEGMLVLLGIEHEDTVEDAVWLSKKISRLRIFDDENGVMNRDIREVSGQALVVSQFTLHAKTKKGNRPSYTKAAPPGKAVPLYEKFVQQLTEDVGRTVETGEFGAIMDIEIVNSGPVTIFIDTKQKE